MKLLKNIKLLGWFNFLTSILGILWIDITDSVESLFEIVISNPILFNLVSNILKLISVIGLVTIFNGSNNNSFCKQLFFLSICTKKFLCLI